MIVDCHFGNLLQPYLPLIPNELSSEGVLIVGTATNSVTDPVQSHQLSISLFATVYTSKIFCTNIGKQNFIEGSLKLGHNNRDKIITKKEPIPK